MIYHIDGTYVMYSLIYAVTILLLMPVVLPVHHVDIL